CLIVIVTPGRTPPLVSVTVPCTVPVTVCAAARPAPSIHAASSNTPPSRRPLIGPPYRNAANLPEQLQTQLDLTRRARRSNLAERIGAADVAAVQRDGRCRRARIVDGQPLRVVERVDEVGAELHPLRERIEI